jgi:drug/metabolite transporter (DMT)-like permease
LEGGLIRIGRAIQDLPEPARDRNAQLGIALMVVATLFFSFQDGVTKTLVQHYSIWELVFIRFCVLLAVVMTVSVRMGGALAMVRSRQKSLQLLRGIVLIGEIALVGLSYRYLSLAEAMTIFHLFPLIGVAMAVVFLKERLSIGMIVSMLLGLVGLLIAAAPASDVNFIGVGCAFGAAILYAAYIVLTRFAAAKDRPITSIFYVCVVGVVIPPALFFSSFTSIRSEHIWLFVLLCAFNIVAQSSVIVALSYARASLVQPINYLQIVWAALVGYWIFSNTPSINTVGGSILIVGAGLLLILSNRNKGPAPSTLSD